MIESNTQAQDKLGNESTVFPLGLVSCYPILHPPPWLLKERNSALSFTCFWSLNHMRGCGMHAKGDNSLFCESTLLVATSFKLLFSNLLRPTNRWSPPHASFRASTCLAHESNRDLITDSNTALRILSCFRIFHTNVPVRVITLSFICINPASSNPEMRAEDLGSCKMYLATMCWILSRFFRTPLESTIASEQ